MLEEAPHRQHGSDPAVVALSVSAEGGGAAGGEEQSAGGEPGADGAAQPVGLHRGSEQPGGTQTPAASDAAGAAAGGDLQVRERDETQGEIRLLRL